LIAQNKTSCGAAWLPPQEACFFVRFLTVCQGCVRLWELLIKVGVDTVVDTIILSEALLDLGSVSDQ